ncbi:hypothetical protein GGR52DRAFT_553731 [Hypoxylon sp. FL1284]|nr:hypothetical protein GGR52DRAFT_553731 [Hypoxylon sp. FL1284]
MADLTLSDLVNLASAEELINVLGISDLQFAFDEYVQLKPSLDAVEAHTKASQIFAMLSWPEPTFHGLNKWARDPPTEEPWAEALFCWRVKRHLESAECTAVAWGTIDYYGLRSNEERRNARMVNLGRYRLVLQILERLQDDRRSKKSLLESLRG